LEVCVLDIRDLARARRSLSGIFVVSVFLAGTCFAQLVLTLSVCNGPPGAKLFVSGSGFDPNANVDIYFDRMQLAVAVTDGTGSFSQIPIQVPRFGYARRSLGDIREPREPGREDAKR
jgi:hypothetical protein